MNFKAIFGIASVSSLALTMAACSPSNENAPSDTTTYVGCKEDPTKFCAQDKDGNILPMEQEKEPVTETRAAGLRSEAATIVAGLTHRYQQHVAAKNTDIPAPIASPARAPEVREDGTRIYKTNGQVYKVSAYVYNAVANTGLPVDGAMAVALRESSGNPNTQGASGTCGLFQFKLSTLKEVAQKHGYSLSANQLRKACFNAEFNAKMHAAYMMPKVEQYEGWAGRAMTSGEYVLMNNLGYAGLKKFAERAWEDKKTGKDTLAVNFFKAHEKMFGGDVAKGNPTLVYNADGTYKTVRQSYNGVINSFGGWRNLQPAG